MGNVCLWVLLDWKRILIYILQSRMHRMHLDMSRLSRPIETPRGLLPVWPARMLCQKKPMAVPNDLFQGRQTASLTIANHNCWTPPSSLLSSERSCSCRCNWAALAYPAKLSAWHHKPKNSWNSRRLPTKKTSISFKHTTCSPPFDCSLRRTGSSRTSSIFIACFKAVVEHMRKSQLHTTMTLRLHNIVQPGVFN